jgi:hypothetical protein
LSSFTHQSLPRWETKDINNDFEEIKEEQQEEEEEKGC